MTASEGRGPQMIAGAAAASGEILLFLHADTLLPQDADPVLTVTFENSKTEIGTFRLRFDGQGRFLRMCAFLTRFDSVFTRFGDQGIAVRRSCYDRLGGFPAWPLFEDVELLRRARSTTRVVSFTSHVTTSARRFDRRGHFLQQAQNAWLLIRFLCGVSPFELAREYSKPSEPQTNIS